MGTGPLRTLVLGGAGFIGSALVKRLKAEGHWVSVIDIRRPEIDLADEFHVRDLREPFGYALGRHSYDEVYQLACDLGGAGYLFNGERDAELLAGNALINAGVASVFSRLGCGRLLFTSSSCVYDDDLYLAGEHDTEKGTPKSAYGWEKLYAEKLYEAYRRNHGLNVCITRFATVYGPGCRYDGGRENAVAALCRKAIAAQNGSTIEVWGDGEQLRPLVYVDDLIEAMIRLMRCPYFDGPVNLSTPVLTRCNDLAKEIIALSGKQLAIKNVDGPTGKRILHLNTELAEQRLGWKATTPLSVGLARTFAWIAHKRAA